jgi:TatA/E family protein of Tat protein translocase
MTGLGLPDVIVVLVIALLFLGPKRLPEAGRAVGHGIREFKESLNLNSGHNNGHASGHISDTTETHQLSSTDGESE